MWVTCFGRISSATGSLAAAQLVPGTDPFAPNPVPVDTTHPVGDPVFGLSNFLGV